ncbi:hypothetical protein [Paenibacillus sp. Y412MC10]|uniref:hypothetical protein n=1 Tax=Geobacillus sp. (strain Y412MC10) TaxID=481743 RepID=UPI0011AB6BC1|nr:hypothetical protein [Paenibacillus sp. Y412MC10]
MTYIPEDEIQKQNAYLTEVFASITEEQINTIIERLLHDYVEVESLGEDDLSEITAVLEHKSIKDFYDLETHPREELWKMLHQEVKPYETEYTTNKVVAEHATFRGWMENSTHPVFQTPDKKLYRADNQEIQSLEAGATGSIAFKANARGGQVLF